tara:strand:- start:4107 stop:5201 length:1095 start_codon:yes stop_codon:yes gene_type:complete
MQTPWHDLTTETPDFTEYCARWKDYVLNKGFPKQIPELQREDNLPHLWPEDKNSPYAKVGVLCVHGFNETAFGMLDIATAAHKFGCRVQTIMLPGHGTSPHELASTKPDLWEETVAYGVRSMHDCEKIILIGNSIGATLSLLEAAANPQRISGALLISPAFGVCSIAKYLARWFHLLQRPLRLGAWHKLQPEVDYARYCSTQYISGLNSISVMRKARNLKIKLSCANYMFLSEDDETIDVQKSLDFFNAQAENLRHLDFYSNAAPPATEPTRKNHSSRFPDYSVLDFSHTGFMHKPDNPHYGADGDFFDFTYTTNIPLGSKPSYFGAITKQNAKIPGLARLHFNPDFDRVTYAIEELLKRVTQA